MAFSIVSRAASTTVQNIAPGGAFVLPEIAFANLPTPNLWHPAICSCPDFPDGSGGTIDATLVTRPDNTWVPLAEGLTSSTPTYHAQANTWFTAVEATGAAFGSDTAKADTNKKAFSDWFFEVESYGFLSDIKMGHFFIAINTLAGTLVPFAGSHTQTLNSVVEADYDSATGFASTGHLTSDRPGSSETQDDVHTAVWLTEVSTANNYVIVRTSAGQQDGATQIGRFNGGYLRRLHNRSNWGNSGNLSTGYAGLMRDNSTTLQFRNASANTTSPTRVSQAPHANPWELFGGSSELNRVTYWSVGCALNQSQLDTSLTTLMGALDLT